MPLELLADLLDLVLPRSCAGCAATGRTLCAACRAALVPATFEHMPDFAPPGTPPVVAAGSYDGLVRTLLLAHKERGALMLAGPLGLLLAAAVEPFGPEAVLVPVPSAPAAVRARGHDHARRLASVAGRRTGTPVRPLLRQVRTVRDAVGLDARARAANLAGALVSRPVPGVSVVVVDDIVTTGATLDEAARALRDAGADVLGAAVVAATPSRSRA